MTIRARVVLWYVGVLVASLVLMAGVIYYEFVVERNGRSVRVVFDGLPPDTFRDDVDATVRGRLQRNNVFVANEIATRCPSRYEMQSRRQQGEQPPAGMPGHVPAATP